VGDGQTKKFFVWEFSLMATGLAPMRGWTNDAARGASQEVPDETVQFVRFNRGG
jgi:hypothetical protein